MKTITMHLLARTKVWIALCLALAVVSPGTAGAASGSARRIDLAGCFTTLFTATEEAAKLQPAYVPRSYRLTPIPGVGLVAFWAFACDEVRTGEGPAVSARFVFVTVRVEKPDRAPTPDEEILANYWDHYLLWILSDSDDLTAALQDGGFPAVTVPRISFHRSIDRENLVTTIVRASANPFAFGLNVGAKIPDVFQPVHNHDNFFWRGNGSRATKLELQLFGASDSMCFGAPECGHLNAPAGSAIARMLGRSRVGAFFAADHIKIPAGRLMVPAHT